MSNQTSSCLLVFFRVKWAADPFLPEVVVTMQVTFLAHTGLVEVEADDQADHAWSLAWADVCLVGCVHLAALGSGSFASSLLGSSSLQPLQGWGLRGWRCWLVHNLPQDAPAWLGPFILTCVSKKRETRILRNRMPCHYCCVPSWTK